MDVTKSSTVLVTTVAERKSKYSSSDYSCTILACKLQKTIGHPNTHDFIRTVEAKQLSNCPITYTDIMAAEDIFRPDVRSLKGKTTQ
jgi:hypothetical protein